MNISFKLRKEDGSITVEASLLIPILLTFLLFLMSLVKISIAEMALQESVSETAQTVAHYSFLSLVIEGQIMSSTEGFIDDLTDDQKDRFGNNEIANQLLDKVSDGVKGEIPAAGELIDTHLAEGAFEDAVRNKYEDKVGTSDFFSPGGIEIIDHNFPQSQGDSDVRIEAENELRLVLPFFEKEINIKKKAVERAWAGG
ncbi:TadE/TadG family type IV pilus assembly protein [Virgibacillus natechei]|uniref:TadE/TadG family type IV pilus assembly protein n=1 Tax=Virgibacillus natechei TaxID=1216297 RepID=UPI001AE4FE13|nr:TadE family protein [Virgibacillus natechei]UZD13756.1 pilus assembly protein [Virgibacillus natechei]